MFASTSNATFNCAPIEEIYAICFTNDIKLSQSRIQIMLNFENESQIYFEFKKYLQLKMDRTLNSTTFKDLLIEVKLQFTESTDDEFQSLGTFQEELEEFYDPRQLTDEQIEGLVWIRDTFKINVKINFDNITDPIDGRHIIYGDVQAGKCFELNTEILMYDGTIKMVQDIVVGDKVMGDDSTVRNVLSLGRGEDDMYSITNIKGEKYVVNSEHILCLKHTASKQINYRKDRNTTQIKWFDNIKCKMNSKSFKNKQEADIFFKELDVNPYINIPVNKYIKLTNSLQKDLKGYSSSVEFSKRELKIDPYLLGLWLGDGCKNDTRYSTQDTEVVKYLKEKLPEYNCYLQYYSNYDYNFTSLKHHNNHILNVLKENNLINNKHIPHNFKCNSRENRLRLLAGLIDSDGSRDKNILTITQSNEKLMDDIVYLCRSLGFACYKKERYTDYDKLQDKKRFKSYRIFISGEGLCEIPIKIKRKQICEERVKKSNVLVSSIIVKKEYFGNYYGFTLDGNHKFLLGNFIVTHNTECMLAYNLAGIILGYKSICVVRNIKEDATQLLAGCETMQRKYAERFGNQVKNMKTAKATEVNIAKWMDKENALNNLIVLGNGNAIKKILKEANESSYNLAIDEADALLNADTTSTASAPLHSNLKTLMEKANVVFAVSATTQGLYNLQNFSKSKNIIKVVKHENYKGFKALQHREIAEPETGDIDLLEKHHAFPAFFEEMDSNNSMMETYDHPRIALVKTSKIVKDHTDFSNRIHRMAKNYKWATIIYNGDGITIRHHRIDEDDMLMGKIRGRQLATGLNTYYFKGAGIKQGLSLLHRLQEKMNITHICILSGKLADRGNLIIKQLNFFKNFIISNITINSFF